MISTQSAGERRLSPGQRDALGKFVPNPFPPARSNAVASQPVREALPIRPRWAGWR